MRLTRQTNYAVRILMYCAANDAPLSRIGDIAKAYSVSELFLFKILQPLTKSGLVESVRGRNGGIRLGRDAADISLLDVVKVTEDNFAMAECFENDATECPLVDLVRAERGIEKSSWSVFRSAGLAIRSKIWSRPGRRSTSCLASKSIRQHLRRRLRQARPAYQTKFCI